MNDAGADAAGEWSDRIRPRLTAIQRLSLYLVFLALLIAIPLVLALRQPWIGLQLAGDGERIVIESVRPTGPSPADLRGVALVAVSNPRDRVDLDPRDLVEEPDGLESYQRYNDFLDRQSRIASILGGDETELHVQRDGVAESVSISPRSARPLTDLPFAFWFQLACAAIIGVIASWVISLRRSDHQAAYFALAGYGCVLSILAASVYSTRELALDASLFAWLSGANHAGAILFAIFMIGLFTVYPRRLDLRWLFHASAIVLSLWWLTNQLQLMSDITVGFYLGILLAMVMIVCLIAMQYRATRHDLPARKALTWLGVSVIVGAGLFSVLMALPILLRYEAALSQAYSFGFFPLIYLGVALGLTRYRLFELDRWAFDVLSYIVAVTLFLAIDIALVSLLALNLQASLGITALIIGLIYLPLRNWVSVKLLASRQPDTYGLFSAASEIALQPTRDARARRWEKALADHFDPLSIEAGSGDAGKPVVVEDGQALDIPAYDWSPPLRLSHAARGRRLFGAPHLATVERIASLVSEAERNRRAYDLGVHEERQRIGRDLHDNVGSMLLSSLRAADPLSSRDLVRGALTDIREIVNGLSDRTQPLRHVVAHLRSETMERTAGIETHWPAGTADACDISLPYAIYRGFTSAHRELISNALRHGDPARIEITTSVDDRFIVHVVSNDLGPEAGKHMDELGGNGLLNLAQRAEQLGGSFSFSRNERGAFAEMRLPLQTGSAQ